MHNIIIQILSAFVPNKQKRKAFRKKYKNAHDDTSVLLLSQQYNTLKNEYSSALFNLYQEVAKVDRESQSYDIEKILNNPNICPYNKTYLDSQISWIELLFENRKFSSIDSREPAPNNPNFFYGCGIRPEGNIHILQSALIYHQPLFYVEDCFLRSIFSVAYKNIEPEFQKSIGFTIDDLTPYYDATLPSRLEQMLNDSKLKISEKQIERAKSCIKKLIQTRLSKYNNQPIFTPEIGRKGIKKVLVVDQSYGDMSVLKGWGSEETFKKMLQTAIDENPDADIIVKTHPDTISGTRGGYYTGLKPHGHIYTQTDPINPISLIQYCDKVYVCTTQFGFEALMCGKEVHTFGMPFYAGWGLTKDDQICPRRNNTRTLEELFYITYIMYSYYVNPETGKRCEIEEAMDYLLKLREKYFEKANIRKDIK